MPRLVAQTIPDGALSSVAQPILRAGPDVVLRPWTAADAAGVVEAFADPSIQRWHARRADSPEEAAEWIDRWIRAWWDERGANWAIAAAAATGTGLLLGRISLNQLNKEDGTASVAYWVTPRARNRGLCTQAVRALCGWAFATGFHRIELEHSTANPASCRVADKAGLAAEGVRRSAALHADGWHDMHVHALLARSATRPGASDQPMAGPV